MTEPEETPPTQPGDEEKDPVVSRPRIEADLAGSCTYASFQNAIPVLKSISVANPTDTSIENAKLSLSASPPFIRAKNWAIDRLVPGDELQLSDRKIELDAGYLAGLDEAERGEITLRLHRGDEVLAEERKTVRLLARDEWGGVADMAQLLPAFVMPNDAAVAKVQHAAADILARHGHSALLDGYQSGDPRRAYMLAGAVYSAIAGNTLHYAEPPASFEARGQKVRRPSKIIGDRLATCLDTTLLFAAVCEAVGLNPVILMFEGHAAAGVWLTKRTLPNAVDRDVIEVRKAIAAREMVVFETTGVTHRPPMTFEQASRLARRRLADDAESGFVAAIDVSRSRSNGITPLASHSPAPAEAEVVAESSVELPLPPMPDMEAMPEDEAAEHPATPQGRIDRWQRKLLDLSLRNRLLNFTSSKSNVPFVCPDPARLEDRLADGVRARIVSLPDQNPLGDRDPAIYRETRGEDIQARFAADALLRDELTSPLDARSLDARLITLHRQAASDLAEGGANTLYLATGFLRWKKKPDDERSYRAPLLLLPVRLERRSAMSQFRLVHHEDEPQINATLLQFLERDFNLPIPPLQGELPRDDQGIDVRQVLERMRAAVRDVPGFEVVEETALATFSFAKFLMWKDLVERTDDLRKNRVVRHLIDTPDQPFDTGGTAFHTEREIDRSFTPADIVTPLPADSSQIVASIAAAEGKDFIVVGPPGTGKSQTIANMIAHCLASGKTVLFVAEKTAALDVVYRRLREHGLGDHCLELHSRRADRRHFLGQLKAAWESGSAATATDWVEINDRLKIRRDQLNEYVEALHRKASNGLTPYMALGIALKGKGRHAPELSWPSMDAHDEQSRRDLEELSSELGRTFTAIEYNPALSFVNVQDWSLAWQEKLLAGAEDYREATVAIRDALGVFAPHLGIALQSDADFDTLASFVTLAQQIQASTGEDCSIILEGEFHRIRSSLDTFERALGAYASDRALLSAQYDPDAIARIPVDEIDRQRREANAAVWPVSAVKIRQCRKLLQSYARAGIVDLQIDLPLIRRMQETAEAVAESPLSATSAPVAGVSTDLDALRKHLELAERLRNALTDIAERVGNLEVIFRAVEPALFGGQAGDQMRSAANRFLAACGQFAESEERFWHIAGQERDPWTSDTKLNDIAARMRELVESRNLLRDWATWCTVRNRAEAHGLGPLVADIESGAVAPEESLDGFRLAYARWWLPPTLDHDDTLRNFRRFQHEHAIEEFQEIDALVRKAASARVITAIEHGLPAPQSVPRKSELGLLRHQMTLQRPSQSIREMIGRMPMAFPKLAPCVLMSPLSIAQYLPSNHASFDVVIFDEASQIATWDAVGAIARGKQTVIVGDPKQLPPTNFFGRNESDEDDIEIEDYEKDLESILDEAKASGLPVHSLRWHYRSRHESLIAFSNWAYYQNGLITFPSPVTEDRAVSFRHIADGVYDRGKSRTNRQEARAIAREVTARLKQWVKLPESDRPTIGVTTFNSQQQTLIQDLLDEARRADPDLEWFFADERIESVFVKNLENVQGDERDVILFSVTYCHDAAGKLTMNFGAINPEGGERRLNVAVTRARQELVVFSGITADKIDAERTKSQGVRDLKTFLDYAERGPVALPAQVEGSEGEADSPFEEAVAEELRKRGWNIVPQVGISGFRVDIGVKHPDKAGAYLAGVECDGATYHSSATARDRDKIREEILRGLGWNILRVWSTDWWFDQEGAADKLNQALQSLHESASVQVESSPEPVEHAEEPVSETPPSSQDQGRSRAPDGPTRSLGELYQSSALSLGPAPDGRPDRERAETLQTPVRIGGAAPSVEVAPTGSIPRDSRSADDPPSAIEGRERYEITDLSGFSVDPDAFFDFSYRDTLGAMVAAVLENEAPVREDLLAQRIARAHGWQRTGRRIRERIQLHLRDIDRTHESTGVFLWPKGSVVERTPYRPPAGPEHHRAISEISTAELRDVVANNPSLAHEEDPALAFARLLDIDRLSASARARLEEVLAKAKDLGD